MPIDEIARMLGARIGALAPELLPAGKRLGREWVCGSLGGEPGGSLSVHLDGAKAGVWMDFAANEGGDALDLVAGVLFAGDKRQALAWARRWLGIESGDPAALAQVRRAVQAQADKAEDAAIETRNAAWRIWLSAQPNIRDTPVEDYLAGRGIDLSVLGRLPGAIRFHPELWCAEAGRKLPAMVTAISSEAQPFMACHRTWLEQRGPGDWSKARLEQPKKVLGGFRGGCIRLWRGASGKALREAPDGEVVDITEGIEDGLTVAMADPESRVLASVSLSNLGNILLPKQIHMVRLWRQNDTKPEAIAAFDRAVSAFLSRGVQVVIPDIPAGIKDVNDLLLGEHQ